MFTLLLSDWQCSVLVQSIVCCFAAFVYGANFSSLPATLPQFAVSFSRPTTDFSMCYAVRASGFFGGNFLAATVLNLMKVEVSKTFGLCLYIITIGITTLQIASTRSFAALVILFFVQGLGTGGIDMMSNCAYSEFWNSDHQKLKRWLQTHLLCFSFGATLGPILIGTIQYETTFRIIGSAALIPPFLLTLMVFFEKSGIMRRNSTKRTTDEDVENIRLNTHHSSSTEKANTLDEIESTSPIITQNTRQNNTQCSDETVIVPTIITYLTCVFYFLHSGLYKGFALCIIIYCMDAEVTHNLAQPANLMAIYWCAMTFNRLLNIFVFSKVTATTKMRIQLTMSVCASVVFMVISDSNYTNLCISTALFGFAGASIFPLPMVVIADYGFTIDPRSTSLFMMAATFGDASIPISIGQLMKNEGRQAFTYLMFAIAVSLIAVFFAMHCVGNYVDDADSQNKAQDKAFVSKLHTSPSLKKRQHFTLGAAIAIQANSEMTLGVDSALIDDWQRHKSTEETLQTTESGEILTCSTHNRVAITSRQQYPLNDVPGMVSSLHGRSQHARSVVSQRKATLESKMTLSEKSVSSVVTTSDKPTSTFTPQFDHHRHGHTEDATEEVVNSESKKICDK